MSSAFDEMLEFNKSFVARKEYESYQTSKLPNKKLAVLSCMDSRLVRLLPAALDFQNGDIKLIKNAGAIINHPFGSAMRSLLICIYFMEVEEVAVIGHNDCSMHGFDPAIFKQKMEHRGIPKERIEMIESLGINLDQWFKGFKSSVESIHRTVSIIKNHPLLPQDIQVRGFLMHLPTGAVEQITT